MKPDNGKNRIPRVLITSHLQPMLRLEIIADMLEVEAKHKAKLHRIRKIGVNLEDLDVDLMDVVLDALGVPDDGVIRDGLMDPWYSRDTWTRQQIENYLQWIQRTVARRQKR